MAASVRSRSSLTTSGWRCSSGPSNLCSGDSRCDRRELAAILRLVQALPLVGGDKDAGRAYRAVDETKRGRRTAGGEQPASRPEHERVDEEQILVDEVVAHQRLNQLAATHHV